VEIKLVVRLDRNCGQKRTSDQEEKAQQKGHCMVSKMVFKTVFKTRVFSSESLRRTGCGLVPVRPKKTRQNMRLEGPFR